ncbi:hypothetical protein Bcep18194_A4871 [Burkholderia lata]|uniref:Uncharacterized protein n=1 Tax=Burkholderia lata (strain ATCC 17760 / DSM 23089 / LMG 22485 / NCIMB 9086 / R18194 / 383) TaxID=482957 RepID=Q39GF0_BURL3|nr:hypothetical protein Bcep18194_A4871 [Burkholderia lata]
MRCIALYPRFVQIQNIANRRRAAAIECAIVSARFGTPHEHACSTATESPCTGAPIVDDESCHPDRSNGSPPHERAFFGKLRFFGEGHEPCDVHAFRTNRSLLR